MRLLHKHLFASVLLCNLFFTVQAQQTNVPPAEFDVIIKTNGDIITARVIEVGLKTIRYKRTDIPDGPVYEIHRNEIYAISYRNQLKEYFTPVDSVSFVKTTPAPVQVDTTYNSELPQPWHAQIAQGEIKLGVGFIRNYSKIKNVDDLTSESGAPAFHLTYLFPYRKNIHIGLMAGLGKFKYSEAYFSEYDQLQVNRSLTENIFTLAVIGRYARQFNIITPYVTGGLAFYSSTIKSEGSFHYIDDDRTVLVKNDARNNGLGLLFRVGLNVNITEKIGGYTDFGNSLTIGQVGVVVKL